MTVSGTGIWHGWTNTLADGDLQVVSTRLDHGSRASRWFPKIRSWIRLGAPIELLSPLSVARILALVALLTWPLTALVADTPWQLTAALSGLALVQIAYLMRVPATSPAANSFVAWSSLGAILLAIGASPGDRRTIAVSLLLLVTAMFVGLFMRGRPMTVAVLLAAVTIPLVTRLTNDRAGFAGAVIVVVAAVVIAVMTAAMARASRLAGSRDADTGVPNARGLRSVLDQLTGPGLVATVRLAGVAEARDALGHDAGSELIRRAVEDLGQVVSANARVGRGGDDEVVVVMPLGDDEDAAIRQAVGWARAAIGSGRYLVGPIEVALDAHIGIAMTYHGGVGDALRHSALAARRAAAAGVLVQTWDGVPTTLTVDDLSLLADLRSAAERRELWLAYQPQVRTPDGAVTGVEALLRWNHPSLGFVSPARFIPLAERTGLIDRLTDWVLGEALDAQLRWRRDGRDLSVSVNVSPLSLRRSDFSTRVSQQIVRRSLPPSCLTVEVTESGDFDVPQAVERLAPLRELGVKIAVDDFGTGYTSLAVIPELPLDEIKIDQCFVRDVLSNPASDAIVRSMCELAHRVGVIAVAEGAEDQAVVDHLTVAGYDLIQGYAFAKPMSESELTDWLDERSVAAPPATGQRGALPSVMAFVGDSGAPARPAAVPSAPTARPAPAPPGPKAPPSLPPPSPGGIVLPPTPATSNSSI